MIPSDRVAEPPHEPVGILLAAGFSRRFGSLDKRHLPWDAVSCLAEASARPLLETLTEVIVVLRPDDGALAERLAHLGCVPVICPHAERGMGASLAWGVQSRADHPYGWIVGLADMPAVSAASVDLVRQALMNGASAVRPIHAGRAGHPVGFSAQTRTALLGLTGDRGAQAVFSAVDGKLIPTDDSGVLLDIDEPLDLTAGPLKASQVSRTT